MRKIIKKIVPKRFHSILKNIINTIYYIIDVIFIPITLLNCYWLKSSRKRKFRFSPITKNILFKIGVFPIIDHYYEPMFNTKHLRRSLREDRFLPAIDFNVKEQLDLLNKFCFNDELLSFPRKKNNELEFSYNYGAYPSGDSECLYSMIRLFKPKRIIEIGCGSSTLMALNAIKANRKNDPKYFCEYTCIEPYETPWLEKTGLKVIRKKVEEVSLNIFKLLQYNDILFIDSSHIIRPQGDVLYVLLEILPTLNCAVLIHFHDICTPKDYFDEWIYEDCYFWNEQYILEAFLSFNKKFKIILATNYLFNHHYEEFIQKCPILKLDREGNPKREVGSFWIQKI